MEHDAVLALQEELRSLADELLPSTDFAAVKLRLHGILSKLPNVPGPGLPARSMVGSDSGPFVEAAGPPLTAVQASSELAVISSHMLVVRRDREQLAKHEAVSKALLLHHGNPTVVQIFSELSDEHQRALTVACATKDALLASFRVKLARWRRTIIWQTLQALSKLPAFTDRSAPKLSALLKVVVTTGAGSVSSKQLYSATTAALLKAAPSSLGLEPADGLQSMDEPGVFLTPSELSVVNCAASCPDVSSGTAALRRIAATTQCSGAFRAWRDAVVYLCVTLYANGKGWPDVIDQWQQYNRAVCKAQLNLVSQLAHRLHSERYNSQSRVRFVPLSFEHDPDVSRSDSRAAPDKAQDAADNGGRDDRERELHRLPSASVSESFVTREDGRLLTTGHDSSQHSDACLGSRSGFTSQSVDSTSSTGSAEEDGDEDGHQVSSKLVNELATRPQKRARRASSAGERSSSR